MTRKEREGRLEGEVEPQSSSTPAASSTAPPSAAPVLSTRGAAADVDERVVDDVVADDVVEVMGELLQRDSLISNAKE